MSTTNFEIERKKNSFNEMNQPKARVSTEIEKKRKKKQQYEVKGTIDIEKGLIH